MWIRFVGEDGSTINNLIGNWTIETGTTTSVNRNTMTITLGPDTAPTTLNNLAGNWTFQTGATTNIDEGMQVITLGPDDTDTTYIFNSDNSGLTVTPGATSADPDTITVTNPYDPDSPITRYDDTRTDYVAGDMVLFDGGSNVNSLYIARGAVPVNTPPVHDGIDDNEHWFLVRSGIVSVQGSDDAVAGLTGNATLRISEGAGIDIQRNGAHFTVATQHTGTHDVDEFTPGWAYSFYDLANNMARTGVVADELGVASFSEIFYIHDGIRLIFADGQGHFSTDTTDPTNIFAFRTYAADQPEPGDQDTRSPLFPGATQDYIVYCQRTTSPTGSAEATVIQVDPPVNTIDELGALMGVPDQTPANENRVFASNVEVPGFELTEHHSSDVTSCLLYTSPSPRDS